jgi:hypothetical protein
MAGTIAITGFVTILFMGTVLIGQPEKIDPGFDVVLPIFEQGSMLSVLNYLYYYLAILSYVITWIITSLLLKDYGNNLCKLKYWIVLSLPLLPMIQNLYTRLYLYPIKDRKE